MATTLATAFSRAKRRYGLDASADDPLLLNALLIDRVNEVIQEAVQECGIGRADFTVNLPTTATVDLSGLIVEVLKDTVRVDYDGDGVYERELFWMAEAELRDTYGVLENVSASAPEFWYTQRNNTADAILQLVLFPRSNTARTNGLKFAARSAPSVLTSTSDNLPILTTEERYILPGLIVAMTRCEVYRGRMDTLTTQAAQVDWEKAKQQWADQVQDSLSGQPRKMAYREMMD